MSTEKDSGSQSRETEECANCGAKVITTVGMDAYTEVMVYTTTEYTREVYCNRDCLQEAVQE